MYEYGSSTQVPVVPTVELEKEGEQIYLISKIYYSISEKKGENLKPVWYDINNKLLVKFQNRGVLLIPASTI